MVSLIIFLNLQPIFLISLNYLIVSKYSNYFELKFLHYFNIPKKVTSYFFLFFDNILNKMCVIIVISY